MEKTCQRIKCQGLFSLHWNIFLPNHNCDCYYL